MKKYLKIENILCLFIILCPIFDIISFLYRNTFQSNYSPSTLLRPIIPIGLSIYLFFKKDKKIKIYMIMVGGIYFIYGIAHLLIFKSEITTSSYSGIAHEVQYLINYTFMILNLWIYLSVFNNSKNEKKLYKSVLIANSIYIISIYISIITKTSSHTYMEEAMGYKGWFESGNSIGAILILSLFIIVHYIKEKSYRRFVIPIILLEGIFLTILLGTRVGLLGFLIVMTTYGITELVISFFQRGKLNKKVIIGSIAVITTMLLLIIAIGSTTFQRRKHLQEIEENIFDKSSNQESHITGDLLKIKEKIEDDLLEEGYMNENQKQSILDLYNICNKIGVKNNDQRMQQLIYHVVLIKNQRSFLSILLGNGYVSHFRELVFEMEMPAFLFNFGILGFILYFIPFLTIWIYAIYKAIKNRRQVNITYVMLLIGCGFVFALSFFAGYTFFNSSNMMIIIVLNTLLINQVRQLEEINKERS